MDYEVGRVYVRPTITDLGSLVALTQDSILAEAAHFASFGAAFATSVIGGPNPPNNPPIIPDITPSGLSPGDVPPSTGGGSGAPSGGGVDSGLPTGGGGGSGSPGSGVAAGPGATSSGSGGAATSGSAGGASSDGGGGSLPFTGYAVALVAGVGLAMTGASRVLRRFRQ
jgi:hypothetical protein